MPTSGNNISPPNLETSINDKKRKYEDVGDYAADVLLPDTFTASLRSKSQIVTFTPVTLVARACLPLAWLNTSAPPSGSSPFVFEATIQSVQEWEQRVLLARCLPYGGLHAIERVGNETFVSCPLHHWVSEEWCKNAAIGIVPDVDPNLLSNPRPASSHARTWSASSVNALPTPKSPKRPKNKRGALARKSILMPKDLVSHDLTSEMSSSPSLLPQQLPTSEIPLQSLPITPVPQIKPENPFEAAIPLQMENVPPVTIAEALISTPLDEEISYERLRNQYLDHLYTSKTSLAFYVKGPLSRARAHVRTAKDSAASIIELTNHYRESVLPTTKIDLKYKESLSKVVNAISTDEGNEEPQKKKSGKKRSKLGKDSLWPDEKDFIRKWWGGREVKAGLPSASGHEEELRKWTAELRTRETKMQLLLILEVMLLEMASARLSETPTPLDPEFKLESVEVDPNSIIAKTPSKATKKKRDLPSELDTMVDRLCIWHTLSFEDFAGDTKKEASSKAKTNDTLRDFCKDVLVPFYSVKLPDQIKSLSRKLGGSGISPQRPKLHARSSQLSRSKSVSGSATRAFPGKPVAKRTLERVLSEDQTNRHASPPILSRASTGPMKPIIPSLKRERSERPDSRNGMLSRAVSFSNREVDLVADSRAHEVKRRKLDRLAEQKRELDAAIAALKKPNRGTVAGAFMDEIEQRKAQVTSQSVQIAATPRTRRIRDQEPFEPELPLMPSTMTVRSQETMIPSSSIKPRFGIPSSSHIPRSSAMKRAVLTAIHETPSRGLERKTSNPLALCQHPQSSETGDQVDGTMGIIAATPAQSRIQSRPGRFELLNSSKDRLTPHPSSDLNLPSSRTQSPGRSGPHMSRSLRPVLFTPIRRSEVRIEDAFRDAPEIPAQAGKMMDRVMGGRGVEADLGLDIDMTLGLDRKAGARLSSSSQDDQSESPLVASRVDEHGGGSVPKPNQIPILDSDDIYAQLGWDDDFDI
ncbi:hypothetical protein LTR84_001911 [Exophiala bonariae]|uniref:DNA replication regulator Sld3 C-terminal domain-containing protein n=1 Tax=Exophiala bonariae TaxID=1690606 RepID=A0AAV9NE57_9EURO|nr:hypothetical protein LTR84_001911 [Exophiala bonariae]